MDTNTVNTRWTDESVLDVVRKVRNDLVKDFLDERFLKQYIATNFGLRELSNVKVEFIRKDLKELLISPVDTRHYEPLISQIKQTDSAALTENNEKLFYRELDSILRKYLYGQ